MKIYVIGTETRQKIGFSGDVEKRRVTLQTGNPETLRIHHTIDVPENRARIVESRIHRELGHKRIKGEWFAMSPKEASLFIDFAEIAWVDDPALDWR
jgi:hypothetical protein